MVAEEEDEQTCFSMLQIYLLLEMDLYHHCSDPVVIAVVGDLESSSIGCSNATKHFSTDSQSPVASGL